MKNSISYLGLKHVRGRGDCYNALGLMRTVVLIPRANALGFRLPVSHAPSCIVTTNPSRNITNVLPFLKLCSPWKCFSHYCPFVRGFHRISSKRDSCGLWCFCRYLKQILKEQWSFRRRHESIVTSLQWQKTVPRRVHFRQYLTQTSHFSQVSVRGWGLINACIVQAIIRHVLYLV